MATDMTGVYIKPNKNVAAFGLFMAGKTEVRNALNNPVVVIIK